MARHASWVSGAKLKTITGKFARMDHRVDIKRQGGMVTIIYGATLIYDRDRQKNSYDESEETSRDVPIVARWLLSNGHAVKADTMMIYDPEADTANWLVEPITLNVGRTAELSSWSPPSQLEP
jgi:hypothetical protein